MRTAPPQQQELPSKARTADRWAAAHSGCSTVRRVRPACTIPPSGPYCHPPAPESWYSFGHGAAATLSAHRPAAGQDRWSQSPAAPAPSAGRPPSTRRQAATRAVCRPSGTRWPPPEHPAAPAKERIPAGRTGRSSVPSGPPSGGTRPEVRENGH